VGNELTHPETGVSPDVVVDDCREEGTNLARCSGVRGGSDGDGVDLGRDEKGGAAAWVSSTLPIAMANAYFGPNCWKNEERK